MPEESGPEAVVDVLARYGQLAAALEETSDPARVAQLHRQLAELDTQLDRLAKRAERYPRR